MKKFKLIFPILLVLLMVALLTACTNDNAMDDQRSNNLNISSISTDDPSGDYPQTQDPGKQRQDGNNYRPIGTNTDKPSPEPNHQRGKQQNAGDPTTPGQNYALNEFENEVVRLTNLERQNAGLSPLEVDNALSNVARQKSQDMQAKNYFSHQSPTYGSPFDMMGRFGITYRSAAENIARGQSSPQDVVEAWMNSEGHRANILNGGFTHIGVGFESNGNYWTQMFIKK